MAGMYTDLASMKQLRSILAAVVILAGIVGWDFIGVQAATPPLTSHQLSSTTPMNGFLLETDGSANYWITPPSGNTLITAGTGISTTTSTGGAVQVNNTGVLSNIAGTGISVSGATGNVTISNTGVLSLQQLGGGAAQTGALTLATSTQTLNGITYGDKITNSAGAFTFTPNNSGVLTVAGGGTGVATLTGCLTGNGTGAITGSGTCNTTNATVSSVSGSGGTTGLTLTGGPITTTGTLTLGGTLIVANGGTGAGTLTGLISGNGTSAFTATANGSNGQILGMSGGIPTWLATTTFSSGLAYSSGNVTNTGVTSIVAGTNVTISGATGAVTINSTAGGTGTVTSIALVGLDGATPITTTGTITAQISTSTVPSVGGLAYWTGAATPSTLGTVATSSETCSSPISCTAHTVLAGGGAITLGTVPYANGGTGSTTAPEGQVLYGGQTAYQSVATSSVSSGTGISFSGTPGALVGGTNLTITNTGVTSLGNGTGITCTGTAPGSCSLASMAAGVLGTPITGIPTSQATSTLYGAASTGGFVLQWSNVTNGLVLAATSTSGGGSGTVTSIVAGTGLTGGTITTSGTIALSVPVSVANGGTNATSFPANSLLGVNAAGTTVEATGTGLTSGLTINYLNATSTTATSTFDGPAVIAKSRILQVGSGTNYVPTGGATPSYVIIDKSSDAQDASLLYGVNGVLKWEVGLPGDDDFHWKSISGTESAGYTFTDRYFMSATTGQVGYGTSVPTGSMEIATSAPTLRSQLTITNKNAGAGDTGAALVLNNQAGHTFYVGTDAGLNGNQNAFINWGGFGTGLFFDSSANIGIDTTSLNAGSTLTVNGNATFNNIVGIGTTTPVDSLTVASTTGPQVALSDGLGSKLWTFRNINANFYLATSSYTATSSNPVFSIISSATANATTTFSLTDWVLKQTSQTALLIQDAFGTNDVAVNTASTTGSIFTVAATTSPSIFSPIKLFDVDQYGHLTASSTGPAQPTVTCVPSGGTISSNSNDDIGTITGGTLSTSCTVTFARAYAVAPIVQSTGSNIFTGVTAESTTQFTVSMIATTGDVINYWVVQP